MNTYRFIIREFGWAITILTDCDCSCQLEIEDHLISIGCSQEILEEAKETIQNNDTDVGFTYSNYNIRRTVMVISRASSFGQFINTTSHEIYHFIQHLSKASNIKEEVAARITGGLNMFIVENKIKSSH